jgi:hypothetical protein
MAEKKPDGGWLELACKHLISRVLSHLQRHAEGSISPVVHRKMQSCWKRGETTTSAIWKA